MGQHRTRKQKELAQQHRIVQSATGMYSLSNSMTQAVSARKTALQTTNELEDRKFILQDLRKTVLILLYIFTLLGILWWKLK
jgi:hypothetical protein